MYFSGAWPRGYYPFPEISALIVPLLAKLLPQTSLESDIAPVGTSSGVIDKYSFSRVILPLSRASSILKEPL